MVAEHVEATCPATVALIETKIPEWSGGARRRPKPGRVEPRNEELQWKAGSRLLKNKTTFTKSSSYFNYFSVFAFLTNKFIFAKNFGFQSFGMKREPGVNPGLSPQL